MTLLYVTLSAVIAAGIVAAVAVNVVGRVRDESWHTGYDAGQRAAEAQTLIDLGVMLTHYPTSRGLRAAIKGMGGTVPALPKRKRTEAP